MKKIFTLISALLILALGGAGAYAMQASTHKLPVLQYFPTDKTIAVWDWTNPVTRTSSDLKQMDNYMYLHQINTVYLDISDYADIAQNNDTAKKQQLSNALANYIKALKHRNIRVFAAAGNTDWSKPTERNIPLSIQNYVFQYNAAHPNARLAGMEFDIEAYNQTGFATSSDTEKIITLTEYLNTVAELTANQAKYLQNNADKNFELGFAIPYWFDNENGNIPSITWNSKTGPTLFHLVDTLNQLPHSNIIVMAYRNAAQGNDGVIFHSRTEVDYAQAKAPNVKVLIGQEVNDVDPAKITYFGKSLQEFSQEVSLINDEFKVNSSYAGIAINDLNGLQQMKDDSGAKL